ncbi:Ras-related protein Rab-21 [Diplonema papillatum]|nr:Ras-related protein Rab-21 [Diplonema papillatum]
MAEKFKIVLLGEGRVGKTSLVRRYVLDEFSDSQKSTVQANMYSSKKLHIDDKVCNISIWDTAGQERFRALGPIYYRDANGALLVYDITDADTFEKVKTWVRELRSMVGDDIRICVAGNKCDMISKRQVCSLF